jgi:hypothetical protein
LAEEEERKVLRYVAQLTGALMKRIESKLGHLDELEAWMTSHKTVYDASASAYYSERIQQQATAEAEAAAAAAATSTPMDTTTTKQEPMNASSSHFTPKPNMQLPATHAHLQHLNNTPGDANPFRAY